ncbi:MAG: endonuclease [Campylobacterota bacterium]|nr:endonuclease [Campylobacterota bacterium]
MNKSIIAVFLSLAIIGCGGEQESSSTHLDTREVNTTLEDHNVTQVDNNTTIPSENNNTTLQLSETLQVYYADALDKNESALKSSLHRIILQSKFLTYSEAYTAMGLTNKDLKSRDEEKVILFYSQESVLAADKCHTISPDGCWNREHLWPKSLGVGYDDSVASYTDLHHLQPANAQVNMDRSNRRFSKATTPYIKIDDFYYDDSRWSWEVADDLKGDVARAMLYMVVRYEGESGEPDLELYAHDESTERPADLCEMLEWNRMDRVSNSEIRRNEIIYQYQNNRNPFIDNNEWVDLIWISKCE